MKTVQQVYSRSRCEALHSFFGLVTNTGNVRKNNNHHVHPKGATINNISARNDINTDTFAVAHA